VPGHSQTCAGTAGVCPETCGPRELPLRRHGAGGSILLRLPLRRGTGRGRYRQQELRAVDF